MNVCRAGDLHCESRSCVDILAEKEQVSKPGVVGMHKEQATHRRRDGGDIYDFLF
jgi:hypothetical protein